MSKFQEWLQAKWQLCAGICLLIVAILVGVLFLTGRPGVVSQGSSDPTNPSIDPVALDQFTIVTKGDALSAAQNLAKGIKDQFQIELNVVSEQKFEGGNAIYVATREFNSYNGYKYRLQPETVDGVASFYVDGSGASLDTAVNQLLDMIKGTESGAYPFGLNAASVGYEWSTSDVSKTDYKFVTQSIVITELYPGVLYYDITYTSRAFGTTKAHAVVLKHDSEAEMRVITSDWDETHSASNPAPCYTITEFADQLADKGYQVLAINNASFFDNEGDFKPMGIQIEDGVVKKEPTKQFPRWSDKWFGMTFDGQYVFSDTDGYMANYKDKNILKYAVSGGEVLMRNGVLNYSGVTYDYRTAVGTNDAGDFAYIAVHDANMAVVLRVMMDLDIDITTVQNLDGGGSTDFHVRKDNGALESVLRETRKQREVTDAIAIVIGG